jgi:hypothetical protein
MNPSRALIPQASAYLPVLNISPQPACYKVKTNISIYILLKIEASNGGSVIVVTCQSYLKSTYSVAAIAGRGLIVPYSSDLAT